MKIKANRNKSNKVFFQHIHISSIKRVLTRKFAKFHVVVVQQQREKDDDLQFTKSADGVFHSVIDLGEKENLKTSLQTLGILYLKAWLLRVLNSLFGIKCSSVFMSTFLWRPTFK